MALSSQLFATEEKDTLVSTRSSMSEFFLNCFYILGCVYVAARIVSYWTESSERCREIKSQATRTLYIKALSGDHKSSMLWESSDHK